MKAAVFFILFLLPCSAAVGDSLRIAVAANFAPTLKKIKSLFEKNSHHRLDIISASSGKIFAQIQHGAPFDIFMSADSMRPEKLQQLGLIDKHSRMTYALGQLALWSPEQNEPFLYLQQGNFKRLAIANPKTAPYGLASIETLKAMGLINKMRPRLVRGENINQTYQFVYSANAEIGFVALSQLINKQTHYQKVPDHYYTALEQQLIITKSSRAKDAARQFINFLKQDKIRNLIKNNGYKVP